eukprot:snap_masked-scaffold_1-processed-gene-17.26-mRNA-1 protein AED:1.00 eAED:1.00 QI:0/0/0/0/1/1/2/0/71
MKEESQEKQKVKIEQNSIAAQRVENAELVKGKSQVSGLLEKKMKLKDLYFKKKRKLIWIRKPAPRLDYEST